MNKVGIGVTAESAGRAVEAFDRAPDEAEGVAGAGLWAL